MLRLGYADVEHVQAVLIYVSADIKPKRRLSVFKTSVIFISMLLVWSMLVIIAKTCPQELCEHLSSYISDANLLAH